jgi:hypothetical protein
MVRVIAFEPLRGETNNDVVFKLTLTCSITQFFNSVKGIENINYVIPADLNSIRYTVPMPSYVTKPTYCMLLPVKLRLIYFGAIEEFPPFVEVDESTTPNQLVVYNTDPTSVGIYDFMILAVEPRTGLQDDTVKFRIAVTCQVKDFAPVYTDVTVYELSYIIRGG